MINLMTKCRDIATVHALSLVFSFAFSFWLSSAIVAQESMDSFPSLELQSPTPSSVLDLPDTPEDLNVLTRGPLHEAFASAHQADPQPSTLVFQAPPALIDEVPPEYKPEGNNVQWISGYWAWDDAQSDFIWISGIWRDVPPNRRWIPGYWNAEGDGHRWVSGIWTEETQHELGYLPQPPASIDQGPSTDAPGENFFYVPGNWDHQNGNYRWLAGHWQPVSENWIWIPSRYVWTPNGCVYQSGYWDYEFQNRGTCFAPVQFTQPIYRAANYSYRPSYAINLNINFLTHMFVRPRCGHYFYGDWYQSNFNNVNYRPWVSYSSHRRSYDPLLTYYRCRRSSFDNRYNVVQHLTRQHNFYVNNRDYRPRPTYKSQHKHANRIKHLHKHGSRGNGRPHEDFIRHASYVSTYKDLRRNDERRRQQTARIPYHGKHNHKSKKHHKVADKELRDTRRKVEQLAKAQRERKRLEHSAKNKFAKNTSGKMRMQNIPSIEQREKEKLRRAKDNARQVAEAQRRRQATERTSRKPTDAKRHASANPGGKRNAGQGKQRSTQNDRRTQPARDVQQEKAKLARQEQIRQQKERESARNLAQQRARVQAENARRLKQGLDRKKIHQDQARRVQQQQRDSRTANSRSSASRNTSGKMRMQNIPSTQQREQAARKAQQDLARKAAQQAQRDAAQRSQRKAEQDNARRAQQAAANRNREAQARARQDQAKRNQAAANRGKLDQIRRAQQTAQQDQARRAQQAAANRAKQDQARRAQQKAQQDQARRAQQAAANRAKQDQARRAQQKAQQDQARRAQQRAQQDQARRAQQEQSRRQAEQQRARQQQSQRDAARRAQQQAQRDAAKRSQQSRSSRLRNRSQKK